MKERLLFLVTLTDPLLVQIHKIANTGSWVTDAQIHNTFVELDGDGPRIWNFKDKDTVRDITEGLTFPIPA